MFEYEFMVRAMLAGLVAGIICPAVGVFVVMRRYSFMADTLAHVSLAGVAAGALLGVYPAVTTLGFAMAAATVIEKLRSGPRLYGEAVLALMMSGGLALAVVLISLSRGMSIDIFGYLFGSVLTVSPGDLWLIAGLGCAVLAVIILFYKELYYISFDEEAARVAGLPVDRLNFIFVLLVAVTVAVSMRIVGTLLVSALMVIPVLTALLVAGSFRSAFITAVFLGVVSVALGLTGSYYLGIAAGGAVVLTALVFFVLTLGGKQLRQAWQRRLLAPGAPKKVKEELVTGDGS
jgi:zinc transport system permease protein